MDRLTKIPKDKLLHFFYGTIIGFPIVLFFGIYGVFIMFFIALVKEVVIDIIYQRGMYEWLDIVYGVVPAILFWIFTLNI